MAVYFDSATDVIGANSGGAIAGNVEARTICGFARIESNAAQSQMLGGFSDSATYFSAALEWRSVGSDTMSLRVDTTAGVANRTNLASRPAVGETFFWYLKCSGTGAGQVEGGWCYLDGSAMVSTTATLQTGADGAAALLVLGGLIAADLRGQMGGVRQWTAALSADDLENERHQIYANRRADLIGEYPLWDVATSLTDFSGNGATLDNLSGFGGSAPSDSAVAFPVRIRARRAGRAVFAAAATPTLDQSHFRFRNDDGSETTATWAAAEDTNVTIAALTPKRLRVEITATNDPASAAYKLQYRKVGDTYWRDVN